MYLLDLFISLVIFKLWGSHTAVEKLYPHACCTLFMNLLVPELMLEKDCSITFENKPMFFLSFVEGREACSLHYHWSWYIFTYETRRHRQLKLINKLRLTLRSNRGRAGMKRYSSTEGKEFSPLSQTWWVSHSSRLALRFYGNERNSALSIDLGNDHWTRGSKNRIHHQ